MSDASPGEFLSGEGRVRVGESTRVARADVVVTVPPGEAHSYENTGREDLVLISLNLPVAAGAL